jgi:hypothetical protein
VTAVVISGGETVQSEVIDSNNCLIMLKHYVLENGNGLESISLPTEKRLMYILPSSPNQYSYLNSHPSSTDQTSLPLSLSLFLALRTVVDIVAFFFHFCVLYLLAAEILRCCSEVAVNISQQNRPVTTKFRYCSLLARVLIFCS